MKLDHNVRFITAASLFDGHDAAIHVMRRILQAQGAEVIHLGHNIAAHEVVKAAIEEDVQGIAISSYQGGHVEYFTYMLDLLKNNGASSIQIFGGGGGVIVDEEIRLLESRGVKKIFSPQDGLEMGLVGMIQFMLKSCDQFPHKPISTLQTKGANRQAIAQTITTLELGGDAEKCPQFSHARAILLDLLRIELEKTKRAPIIGITGTGGAGKSSLIDELLLRMLQCFPEKKVAVLSVDPTKARTGGALLGDRIRMNSAENDRIFVRSMATRSSNVSVGQSAKEVLPYLALCDFDLVLLESAGIGQSNSEVKNLCDASLYIMTPEFGAPTQLEKIDMLDWAQMVAINKFDKPGSLDALAAVRKTYQRNHELFDKTPEAMPVFGTCAHIFGDLGTNRFFNKLITLVESIDKKGNSWKYQPLPEGEPANRLLIPKNRSRYLSQIAEVVREHHQAIDGQQKIAEQIDAINTLLDEPSTPDPVKNSLSVLKAPLEDKIDTELLQNCEQFFETQKKYEQPKTTYSVRGQSISVDNFHKSLSHIDIPKVKAPVLGKLASAIRYVGMENLPGFFPFTAGVFPFKRTNEDPTRMFAGEGTPERTNKRFHYLSHDTEAKRLSTAFDSVTLYGKDPDLRPDIFGKVGNAGVSVCSLDDAKRLYSGFDLISPNTSVSMTINGPAPTMLAFFFNAAIDFEVEKQLKAQGKWPEIKKRLDSWFLQQKAVQPIYRAELPQGHNGIGLGFLGCPSELVVDQNFYQNVKSHVLKNIRGTIQADILKEDQAQNTCIFSTEFSLALMGDCQEFFIKNHVDNFYSVSISGYHIAEAGANPISQLAFTLANGFTMLEYYKARGMKVDDFAKNFSFFFSNGIDPEYAVIGRVARRIWAIALKKIYGANERSQKLKYHIQTSGRSLHAQEITFNDIRTTLQALYAIADNCNSLHTNAFDEAITTPTEDSVRQAMAIQMIINHELGLTKNENPWAGSYFLEDLTNKVEAAVLKVFDSLDVRGGVLGAMETMYQRSVIQEESLYYEHKKHAGELPIIGVNTFINKKSDTAPKKLELMRSTTEEKNRQVEQIEQLHKRFLPERNKALTELTQAALLGQNVFEPLMNAAKYCTIGEITKTFFAVGGAYRRAM